LNRSVSTSLAEALKRLDKQGILEFEFPPTPVHTTAEIRVDGDLDHLEQRLRRALSYEPGPATPGPSLPRTATPRRPTRACTPFGAGTQMAGRARPVDTLVNRQTPNRHPRARSPRREQAGFGQSAWPLDARARAGSHPLDLRTTLRSRRGIL